MLREKAELISDLLIDYKNNNMSPAHIIDWVSQFDEIDQKFLLDELLFLFKKTYFSKAKCKELLSKYLEFFKDRFKYSDVPTFLKYTEFLDLQPQEKSQKELLCILEEIIEEKYGMTLSDCGELPDQYIYLDDI